MLQINSSKLKYVNNSSLNLANYTLIFEESCSRNCYIGGVLCSLLAVFRNKWN